jgi:hypothetical protein
MGVLVMSEVGGASSVRKWTREVGSFLDLSLETVLKVGVELRVDLIQEILESPGNRSKLQR